MVLPMKKIVLLGHPLGHSFSPVMQNAAIAAAGLGGQLAYEAWDTSPEALGVVLLSMRSGEVVGANVTIPYKVEILRYLDGISSDAQLMGAANTLCMKDGRLLGYNTDGAGFLKALAESGVSADGRTAVVMGAGGAARAVAFSLARSGAREITVANRDAGHAQALASEVSSKTKAAARAIGFDSLGPALASAQLAVNCTPLGLKGLHENETPIPRGLLHPGLVVVDGVYNPRETLLLREAREAGCRVVSGDGMLLHQGALGFKIWTGIDAPVDAMRTALAEAIA